MGGTTNPHDDAGSKLNMLYTVKLTKQKETDRGNGKQMYHIRLMIK